MKEISGHAVGGGLEPLEPRKLLSISIDTSTPALANVITFADGNGNSTSNQYPGTAGAGWAAGWSRSSKSFGGTVLSGSGEGQSPPIDLVQPDYLQVTASGVGAVARAYAGTDATSDRVIQFDYRFDGTTGGDNAADTIEIFGDNTDKFGLDPFDAKYKTNTWAIKALISQKKAVWQFGFLDRHKTISFLNNPDAVRITQGDLYQFTINEYLVNGTGSYTATVRDTTTGGVYATASALPFCSGELSTDRLEFGMSLATGEIGKFSVDAIHVATVATPAPVIFAIGGLGTPQNPEPGVESVTQAVAKIFSEEGIADADIRGYEQNYDSDKSVNPNGDSIAAEIDKVPAGTPVVLMGFSFGGSQAVSTASQISRPISAMILFDPVLQTDYADQVYDETTDPMQIIRQVPSNVQNAVEFSRVIFQPNGKLYPSGPYAFKINGRAGTFETFTFPRSSGHVEGQITPRSKTPGIGPPGDPINDTAQYMDDAVDGFPLFWDGVDNAGT